MTTRHLGTLLVLLALAVTASLAAGPTVAPASHPVTVDLNGWVGWWGAQSV